MCVLLRVLTSEESIVHLSVPGVVTVDFCIRFLVYTQKTPVKKGSSARNNTNREIPVQKTNGTRSGREAQMEFAKGPQCRFEAKKKLETRAKTDTINPILSLIYTIH